MLCYNKTGVNKHLCNQNVDHLLTLLLEVTRNQTHPPIIRDRNYLRSDAANSVNSFESNITFIEYSCTKKMHAASDQDQDPGHRRSSDRVSSVVSRVEDKWNDIQVGRQGKYSLERLESLDHYCKTASKTRVLLVCMLTPVPALLAAIMLELLPLQEPSKGWAANWIFWIRLAAIVFLLNCTGVVLLRRLVRDLPLTLGKVILLSTGVSAGYTGLAILLAALVGFPVPCMLLVCSVSCGIILSVLIVLMFGIAPFRNNSPLRPHLSKFFRFLTVHVSLASMYPFFKVLYTFVPANYQGFVMLLLPVWKFGAQKYVGRAMHELEDFALDLTSTISVHSSSPSGSVLVSVLAIVAGMVLSLLEYRELRANASAVYSLLRYSNSWSKNHLGNHTTDDLLTLLLKMIRDPVAHNVISLPSVRLWACEPHPLSNDRLEILKTLATLDVFGSRLCHSVSSKAHMSLLSQSLGELETRRVSCAAIGPTAVGTEQQKPSSVLLPHQNGEELERSKQFITQGLQLLFHCEYLVIVKYVECIVPMVFVAYQLVLYQLPNIVYAPEGWQSGAIGNILLLTTLKICSLVALKVLLERKFALSPLYQLAFVLETQVELVQTGTFIATTVLLPFELTHFGMDFSFRFDWLRNTST
ncbi:hypothetical protein GN244_ATG15051 [Phytophthora infestans]|uniref:Transmembrane protein n=1 Tax=Phytophthora infestans TaxID=4787 RepID=A0A833RTN2_PHYIN|nr:hypothetical protein GN244_ATG15051 [Phytophthora infestans]